MKTKKILVIIFTITVLLNFSSCDKKNDPAPIAKTEIFLAGQKNINANNWAAAYYKDGEFVTLGDGSVESNIYDITFSGNDVYMAGVSGDKPAYWKNGEIQMASLPADSWAGQISNIVVKGNDIYMVGRLSTNAGDYIGYWKNGVVTELAGGYPSWLGNGLIVTSNNDVYIAGKVYTDNQGGSQIGYWKNGVWTTVGDPQKSPYIGGIAVSGSDVYVAGTFYEPNVGWTACYWKNGTQVTLGLGWSYEIKIVNQDVFVAGNKTASGNNKDVAVYWKNGNEVKYSDGTADSYIYRMEFKGNDIYASGEVYDSSIGDYKTVLWKNGETITPFDGKQAKNFGDFYGLRVR